MTVPPDRILAEEDKLDVRLERFVASADAATGRDQDGVVVFVSRRNCETWAVRQKAAMPCSLEFPTGCLTTCFLWGLKRSRRRHGGSDEDFRREWFERMPVSSVCDEGRMK